MQCETIFRNGAHCSKTAAYKINGICLCASHGLTLAAKKWINENPDCILVEKHMKILLINGAHGKYVPQAFAQTTPRKWLSGYKKADLSVLFSGPDHADYWEAWEDVLNHTTLSYQGKKFYLWQDGDLWAIPEGESPED